jgi:hypothetical protein
VEEARDTPIMRTAKMVARAPVDPAPGGDDWRDRLTRVLRESGLPVVD